MQYKHATFLLCIIFIGTGILTVAVFQRRAALEETEEISASAIRQTQEIEAELPVLSGNQYRAASMDVNGDGMADAITLTLEENQQSGTTRTLRVNRTSVEMVSGNPQMYFGIVDIDTADGVKEIALSDEGPSGDPTTELYRFDGTALIKIGSMQGLYEFMTFNGAGTVTTETRASILDTWAFEDQFTLDSSGMLVHVDKDFYTRLGDMNDITVLQDVGFDTSPTSPVPAFSAVAGDVIQIVGCDNIAWCKVANSAGVEGWFQVDALSWSTLMTGWSLAD
jgi:hypothetical protein